MRTNGKQFFNSDAIEFTKYFLQWFIMGLVFFSLTVFLLVSVFACLFGF